MKLHCWLTVLLLCVIQALFAQSTPILAKFDFSKPGYAILVMPLDGGINARYDSTADVAYFDQPKELEAMKKGLVVHGEAIVDPVGCHDSHAIVVAKGGREQAKWTVSPNCHSIEANEEEAYPFSGYIPLDGFKVATRKTHHFSDVDTARKSLAEFEQSPDLLYIPKLKWREFNGEFMVMIYHCTISNDAQRQAMEAYISKNYPDEKVEIHSWLGTGNSEDGFTFCADIRCKPSFWEKFRMDKVNCLLFKPYPLKMESFWKH
jgi:hypothetical protein